MYLKGCVTQSHLSNLHIKTNFQPCIDYCITIWGYTADKHLNKVQRIMNRAARIISGNLEYDVRGVELFKAAWVNEFKGKTRLFYGFACI